MNRWFAVVGGVSMNLALGSLYAWSVFIAPLEAEFGWTRTQTSWVFTIAIVTFALSFVLAGRIQDRRGPRILRSHRRDARWSRVHPRQLHELASVPVRRVRVRRRRRQRIRVRDAHPRWVEVVPRQARSCRWLDGCRIWWWVGDFRTCCHSAHLRVRVATDISDSGRGPVLDVHVGDPASQEPARRISTGGMEPRDGAD